MAPSSAAAELKLTSKKIHKLKTFILFAFFVKLENGLSGQAQ